MLLLDRIQDPGNLGTLIRTADAAGIDMIVMEKGTADAYQDKVMRASQGSVFHIPIVTTELNKFIEQFDGPVYGTALENAVSYKTSNRKTHLPYYLVMKEKVLIKNY